MKPTLTIVRTCERCGRPVGMLSTSRARAWEPDDKGRPICVARAACNQTRDQTRARPDRPRTIHA